ncbi:MAG TPA: aspartate 1-decarboxylase, partial [Caldithrix abyssi]|nr:aspartate 1-decarboxylase [Caldithrix abyssi]
ARLGQVGDLLIIISYAHLSEDDLSGFRTKAVLVDRQNRIKSIQTQPIK